MTSTATDPVAEAERAYRARTVASAHHHEEAVKLLAGGVSANVKFFPPYPLAMARAEGAYLWDLDGNRYIDYLLVYGAVILGHGHPAVMEAIRAQLAEQGAPTFGTPHRLELAMAGELRRLYPAAELVRFTNSGLEATLLCLRLAAAHTGRHGVAKFEGHYHGAHDQVLVSYAPPLAATGDPKAPSAVPDSRGIAPDVLANTLVLPWNDWEGTARLLRAHHRELSCVILEPVLGGFIPPEPDFLERLRRLCAELEVLVVYDEVKTGFRLAPGGAQQRFGVAPDLTALGKILGGGFPVGAVVGRAEVMRWAKPGKGTDALFHSGTYNGHPTAMAAGLAVLRELQKPGVYERIEALTAELKLRVTAAGRHRGFDVRTPGVGSVFAIVFADAEPRTYRELARADATRRRALDLRLLASGVFARAGDRYNLSLAHTESDIATTAEAFERAMATL
jgi:glutamate-1-semialdehyde 2,1-aminomutase